MDEVVDDPGPRQLLQVETRLAELDAVALHVADPEALANQVVQAYAAHGHLAARLARREADVGDDLVLDERQRLAGPGTVRAEVTVAVEPLAGDRPRGLDRSEPARYLFFSSQRKAKKPQIGGR